MSEGGACALLAVVPVPECPHCRALAAQDRLNALNAQPAHSAMERIAALEAQVARLQRRMDFLERGLVAGVEHIEVKGGEDDRRGSDPLGA